jgi:hypothetical protein
MLNPTDSAAICVYQSMCPEMLLAYVISVELLTLKGRDFRFDFSTVHVLISVMKDFLISLVCNTQINFPLSSFFIFVNVIS